MKEKLYFKEYFNTDNSKKIEKAKPYYTQLANSVGKVQQQMEKTRKLQ